MTNDPTSSDRRKERLKEARKDRQENKDIHLARPQSKDDSGSGLAHVFNEHERNGDEEDFGRELGFYANYSKGLSHVVEGDEESDRLRGEVKKTIMRSYGSY